MTVTARLHPRPTCPAGHPAPRLVCLPCLDALAAPAHTSAGRVTR